MNERATIFIRTDQHCQHVQSSACMRQHAQLGSPRSLSQYLDGQSAQSHTQGVVFESGSHATLS